MILRVAVWSSLQGNMGDRMKVCAWGLFSQWTPGGSTCIERFEHRVKTWHLPSKVGWLREGHSLLGVKHLPHFTPQVSFIHPSYYSSKILNSKKPYLTSLAKLTALLCPSAVLWINLYCRNSVVFCCIPPASPLRAYRSPQHLLSALLYLLVGPHTLKDG